MLNQKILQLTKELQLSSGGHIFYYFHDEQKYIENTVSYIHAGIEQGDCVLIIENERIFPSVYKKMQSLLTEEQLTMIHYINNFDFYCLNGDFHSETILEYFSSILDPYLTKNISIRTWAHVEWGNIGEITDVIGEFENQANKAVSSLEQISVCAYDADRVPESLKESLLRSHEFLMTDEEITKQTIEQEK